MTVEERGGGEIYGFDSFQGLPEPWLPGMPAGTFAQPDLPEVDGAQLVVGLFENVFRRSWTRPPGLLTSCTSTRTCTAPRRRCSSWSDRVCGPEASCTSTSSSTTRLAAL